MDRPNELGVFFFNCTILITQLSEDFCECGKTYSKLGLEGQNNKCQISRPRQRAEVLERIREGGTPGP